MKKGWTTKTLGEVCQLISGQHIDSKDYNTDSRGVGYLTGPSDFGPIHPVVSKWTEHPKIKAKRGDVLITVKGSGVGKINLLDADEVAISRQLMAVRVTGAEPSFIYAVLGSTFDHFQSLSTGAAIPGISREQVLALKIALPPMAEQQRIVGLLDKAFAGLATAQAHAEQNLQNARALFESHLQSVFTQRGKGWEEKKLEEVLMVQPQNGWSPPAANHADSGTPVLTLSAVTGFVFRADKLKYTSANTDPKARYWIQNGDFLITRSNTPELVGHVAIASGIERPTIYPDLIMRMRPDPAKVLTEFLYYQMRTPALREEITGRAQGANPTMKKISNGAVRTLPISLPPLDEQRAIVAQLAALSAETQRLAALYTQKLAALAALKQSLLHQAFAGEL